MILEVKVTPYSAKNDILRWEEGRLVMKIRGVPEKGRVNETLCDFLAQVLEIGKSHIEVVGGKTARLKKLRIQGLSLQQVKEIVSAKYPLH